MGLLLFCLWIVNPADIPESIGFFKKNIPAAKKTDPEITTPQSTCWENSTQSLGASPSGTAPQAKKRMPIEKNPTPIKLLTRPLLPVRIDSMRSKFSEQTSDILLDSTESLFERMTTR